MKKLLFSFIVISTLLTSISISLLVLFNSTIVYDYNRFEPIDLEYISSIIQPGDIHIASDGWNKPLGYNHGHAGLVLNRQTNLEIANYGMPVTISNNIDWTRYRQYALLRINDLSTQDIDTALSYATSDLITRKYNVLGSKDMYNVNCASLVVKAFYDTGIIDLVPNLSPYTYITPNDLINSKQVTIIYSANIEFENLFYISMCDAILIYLICVSLTLFLFIFYKMFQKLLKN